MDLKPFTFFHLCALFFFRVFGFNEETSPSYVHAFWQIVSCTPDPTASNAKSHEATKSSPARDSIRKVSQCPDNLRKCHHAEKSEAHGPIVEATPSPQSPQLGIPPGAEAQTESKACPNCHLKRLESERSMAGPDGRARQHRQIHREPDRVSIDRSSKAAKNSNRVSAEHGMRGTPEPDSREKPRQSQSPPSRARLADIPTRRTMSQKRSRVETSDRRSDAESTRMKGSQHESTRRTVSPKDGRPTKTCLSDRTARIHQVEKRKGASPTLKMDPVIRQLGGRTLARAEEAPSRRRSPSRKEHVNRVPPDRELSTRSVRHVGGYQVGPHRRMLPPPIPRRESIVYSSLSDTMTTQSDSSASEVSLARRAGPPTAFPAKAQIVPRRMPSRHAPVPSRDRSPSKRVPEPRRRLSHHRAMRPSRVSAGPAKPDRGWKPEKQDGRLRRFKDKLAIIFHHHHHHHHHHHLGHVDGGDDTKKGGARHHRSPWKHLGRILHQRSEEGQGKLLTEVHAERAADRAPARHQHGYFREFLEALVRHVWRSRKKKAVRADRGRLGRSASRVRVKKLHWWQRFRRRGGVKLTNGKKPRLRLRFSKTNPRTSKRPAAV
ncbi:serine/arginine repetitive matrix protein 1 [Phoenix dactylifera]|uniref:Serine/arginine repetitive matrix protein 1 n=2 Tax=Phoenix dactylifera TaxID=42345 RepID=A0A8B8IZ22_PHODC|nr:serine/arginine repetitive matrix protein 1 [Phoenix dactylifera]